MFKRKRESWKDKARKAKRDTGKKSKENRDFPSIPGAFYNTCKAVCKRCHCVMSDAEPAAPGGEFYHPSLDKNNKPHTCKNAGKVFDMNDLEMEPFMRKSRRRALKRLGIRP